MAILVAVSTARANALVASAGNSPTVQTATTGDFQAALAVGAGFAAIGILVAVLVILEQECHREQSESTRPEPW